MNRVEKDANDPAMARAARGGSWLRMILWSAALAGGALALCFATPVAIRFYHIWLWRGRSADDVVRKTYDVRDLTSTPNVTRGWSSSADEPAYETRELLSEIREAVGRYNWPENKTRLEEQGGKLTVAQIPEMHARISELLEEMRRGRCRQVMIETWFLIGGECTGLLRELGASPGAAVTPEQVRRLRKEIGAAGGREISCPRLTAFNGQAASVSALEQRTFSTGFDEGGAPRLRTIPLGCRLRVCSAVSSDRRRVELDLTAAYCKLLGVQRTPTPHGPAETPVLDDRVTQASVALPSGGWTAVALEGEDGAQEVVVLVRALVVDFVEEEWKL
jgi:hypothetical protein